MQTTHNITCKSCFKTPDIKPDIGATAVVPEKTGENGKGAVQLAGSAAGPEDDGRYGGSTTPGTGIFRPVGKVRLGGSGTADAG